MNKDVFISHSSIDKEVAKAICSALERKKIKCFIAPRDIEYGADWAEVLGDSIGTNKIFVLVFSKNASESKEVKRELALAADLTVIPFKIDNTIPVGSFKYYLTSLHRLDAVDGLLEKHINKLVKKISDLLNPARPSILGCAEAESPIKGYIVNSVKQNSKMNKLKEMIETFDDSDKQVMRSVGATFGELLDSVGLSDKDLEFIMTRIKEYKAYLADIGGSYKTAKNPTRMSRAINIRNAVDQVLKKST